MDLVIIWVVLGIVVNAIFSGVVAFVAPQRGRSAAGFFFLSFFFSFLVGILVLLALPIRQQDRLKSRFSDAVAFEGDRTLVKCPYCAEWISGEAKVCKHCGREVASEIRQTLSLEQETRQSTEQAESSALESQRLASAAKRRDFLKSRNFKVLVVVGSVVLLASVAGGVVYSLTPKPSPWISIVAECDATSISNINGDTLRIEPLANEWDRSIRCIFGENGAFSSGFYSDMGQSHCNVSDTYTGTYELGSEAKRISGRTTLEAAWNYEGTDGECPNGNKGWATFTLR